MPTSSLFRFSYLPIWICLLLLSSGCDGPAEWPPLFYFSHYPVRHPLDLTKVVGREVRLLSGQDTLELRIQHDASTRLNLLTDAVSGDTLQRVWVCRYRGLYYFTWPISDTRYWVHAVRIKRNQVQGLDDAYRQLNLVEQAVRAGQFPDLVQHHDSATGILQLQFEPKKLHRLYTTMLDSLPIYKVEPRTPYPNLTTKMASTLSITQTSKPLLNSMYPNPASDILTLRVTSNATCEATIYDIAGRPAQTISVPTATTTAQVQHLPAGNYVVRVREATTGRVATQRLRIEH
ncbi:T9SS type A sorting domain-containing protein [Hymenobacter sp. YC55]|uniref:T9SS type A sorting domain-containing protein n=1 Tax=Hymenobacter sp. YC55 TaxID=3034019 RepID=UPI0023F6F2A9|nr:T9SS type A sorting domain-containing protein [Hymenobacter sp. YC55]MDF7813082.1 T9SS type A sorting domain-containing protein [Hymenobacter sp. YC55]